MLPPSLDARVAAARHQVWIWLLLKRGAGLGNRMGNMGDDVPICNINNASDTKRQLRNDLCRAMHGYRKKKQHAPRSQHVANVGGAGGSTKVQGYQPGRAENCGRILGAVMSNPTHCSCQLPLLSTGQASVPAGRFMMLHVFSRRTR